MGGIFSAVTAGLQTKSVGFDANWELFFDLRKAKSGVPVTVQTALGVSTVLDCARVIAEGCAQLPLRIVRRPPGKNREELPGHPVRRLLTRRPNDWQTAFEFRETMTLHAVLTGNGYAYIGDVNGEPIELTPICEGSVQVEQESDYTLKYHIFDGKKLLGTVPRERMFHLRGPSWDGIVGLDLVQKAREAIGLAIATEQTHASLHANGARPGGILAVEGDLSPESREALKKQWNSVMGGVENAFRTAVLDSKASWTPFAFSGVDNQHIELRKFQIEEICRALKVFPQMVGHAGDQTPTFASAEAFFSAHVRETLKPWAERWKQAVDRDLLDYEGDLEPEFDFRYLTMGNVKDRAEYNAKALGSGGSPAWLTPNEVRADEGRDPHPDGDKLPQPTNPSAQPSEG